jgi:tRNA (guanine37-N1)-methyltransferase
MGTGRHPFPDAARRGRLRRVRIDLITIFPEPCLAWLDTSIVGRARRRGLVQVVAHDPRAWAGGRHRKVDDRPCGGGPGMVLAAPPIAGCLDAVLAQGVRPRLLMTSPQGRRLDQAWVRELAAEPHLVALCGHYEGIDQRIVDLYRPELFSVGDYVLSGGELAALTLTDAVVRLLPGALGNADSAVEESFRAGDDDVFDHPCYTRPPEFRGHEVPAVLLGGDHAAIAAWRSAQRRRRDG